MKYIIAVVLILYGFTGCDKVDTYDLPFVDDNFTQETFSLKGHRDMCDRQWDSMFCIDSPTVGGMQPNDDLLVEVVDILSRNTKYEASEHWHYTETAYEYMVRDCEDEAMTMIHHMVDMGYDKKYFSLVYQMTSETTAHMFVAALTSDKGMRHMDLGTVTAPIEKQINFHLRMDDVYDEENDRLNWKKGNI